MDFYALSDSSEILISCQDIFASLVEGRFVRLGQYDLPFAQPHIYSVAEDMVSLMGLNLREELVHGGVAEVLFDGSCVIDGAVEDTASGVFVGLDDNVIVIVIKLLCQSPLARC